MIAIIGAMAEIASGLMFGLATCEKIVWPKAARETWEELGVPLPRSGFYLLVAIEAWLAIILSTGVGQVGHLGLAIMLTGGFLLVQSRLRRLGRHDCGCFGTGRILPAGLSGGLLTGFLLMLLTSAFLVRVGGHGWGPTPPAWRFASGVVALAATAVVVIPGAMAERQRLQGRWTR